MGIFALDAFESNRTLWENLLGFIIHLVPSLLEFFALAIAWKFKTYGGLLFLALVALSFFITGARNTLPVYLMIAGPPLVAGVLFIVDDKI